MKQFYETYSDPQFLLSVPDPLKGVVASNNSIVTTMLSQLEKYSEPSQFVTTVLTQIQWSAHLQILNKTKSPEEKIFYLLHAIKERLSVRELERQLNAAVYERTMLSDKSVSSVLTQIPQGVFKDPYIFEFLNLPDESLTSKHSILGYTPGKSPPKAHPKPTLPVVKAHSKPTKSPLKASAR